MNPAPGFVEFQKTILDLGARLAEKACLLEEEQRKNQELTAEIEKLKAKS